jgi:hypothetical protein
VVGGMQFVELTIDVEDTLRGPPGDQVTIEVVEGLGLQEGDAGFWFLHRKKDAPDRVLYRLANSESMFLVRDGRIEPIDPTRPWIAAFEGASEDAFRVAVSDAVAAEVVPPSPAF